MTSFVDYLVDTQVRGLVCDEASGAAAEANARGERRTVPVETIAAVGDDHAGWLAAARAAIARLLAR